MVLKYKLNKMYWLQNLISSQRNIPCEFIKTPQIWPWSPWCPRRWSSRGRATWPRPVWCCWSLGAVITESHQNHMAKMVEALFFINLIHSTAAKFWLGQFLYFIMVLLVPTRLHFQDTKYIEVFLRQKYKIQNQY